MSAYDPWNAVVYTDAMEDGSFIMIDVASALHLISGYDEPDGTHHEIRSLWELIAIDAPIIRWRWDGDKLVAVLGEKP